MRNLALAPLVVLTATLSSCAGAKAGPHGTPPVADAAAPPPDAATTSDGSASDAAAGASAAGATIAENPLCTAIPAFYWEIGDVSGPLASGTHGSGFTATTKMNIASASKMVFGAYVVERFKNDLSQIDANAMRMLAGYTQFVYDTCVTSATVADCLAAAKNNVVTPAAVGKFYYSGGNFQSYAAGALGLGADTNATLATEVKSLVGNEFAFTYSSPQLAAGINTSASDYAAFLRKILGRGLALYDHLGENAVCTLPSACPAALYSPSPGAWHYSYAHWVEDDPTTGDGSFSSPGAFGFYPWIDATKTYYGILARYSLGTGAAVESAECGAAIRKAFFTGVAQ